MGGYANYETVLDDARVWRIQERVMDDAKGRLPDDTDFVTFIQPATIVDREGIAVPIPDVAVFAIVSPNPKDPSRKVMTQGAMRLDQWRRDDFYRTHYVGAGVDPAMPVFRRIAREHVNTLRNLAELI